MVPGPVPIRAGDAAVVGRDALDWSHAPAGVTSRYTGRCSEQLTQNSGAGCLEHQVGDGRCEPSDMRQNGIPDFGCSRRTIDAMNAVAGADPYFPPSGVCVSGAAGAIGSATCRRFIKEGWLVVAVDRSDRVLSLAADLGPLCVPVVTDLGTPEGCAAVHTVLMEVGGIDHVVAIAGGAMPEELAVSDAADLTPDLFAESVSRNLVDTWSFVRATLPALRSRHGESRSITFCSSRNAVAGHGLPAYSAAKAGLLGLMNPLAGELGPEGIRVNAVLPGQIATPYAVELHAGQPGHFERIAAASSLGRLATEDDCADAFWAFTQMKAVTATYLVVDCGAHTFRQA